MNKKTLTTKKKAFSLIELSIVLIIIGLLVAGVTGGASLIKNAELRGVMSEARGYQTAVNGFFERFQALPGDYTKVIGTASGSGIGNGDGSINYVNSITATYVSPSVSRAESNGAWQHLKNGGFVTDAFTAATTDITGVTGSGALVAGSPGINLPASKNKGGSWIFDYIGTQNVIIISAGIPAILTGASAAITANSLIASATSSTSAGNMQIMPADALSIDTKTDDGVANAGKVTALGGAGASLCSSTATYTTGNGYKACALAFQIDPNS